MCLYVQKKILKKKLKFLESYKKIIIEEFIPGREIQAALIGSKKLGAIELKPKRKFYDYQAKYNTNAKTQHIIKINLPFEPNTKVFPSLNTLAKNFVLWILISIDEGYFLNTV